MANRIANLRERATTLQQEQQALSNELNRMNETSGLDLDTILGHIPDIETVTEQVEALHGEISTLMGPHHIQQIDDSDLLEQIVAKQAASHRLIQNLTLRFKRMVAALRKA